MTQLTLVVAFLALAVALRALLQARAARDAAEDAAQSGRRALSNTDEELRAELEVTRRLLARLVSGETLTGEMILEGQLWRDVDTPTGQALIAAGEVIIVDVRTPQETESGTLPGARLIPMDELEERKNEIPRGARTVLVYCATGGRSAVACEFLAREGWERLHNLESGIAAWDGTLERPA